MTSEQFQPAEVFSPGEYIGPELLARGWSRAVFARKMNMSEDAIDGIVYDGWPITPEIARRLGAAFGSSPKTWMGLEDAYRRRCGR